MRRNLVEERNQLPEHIGPDYFVTGKRLLNREMESPLTIEATNDKYLDQWGGDDNILSQLTLLRNVRIWRHNIVLGSHWQNFPDAIIIQIFIFASNPFKYLHRK